MPRLGTDKTKPHSGVERRPARRRHKTQSQPSIDAVMEVNEADFANEIGTGNTPVRISARMSVEYKTTKRKVAEMRATATAATATATTAAAAAAAPPRRKSRRLQDKAQRRLSEKTQLDNHVAADTLVVGTTQQKQKTKHTTQRRRVKARRATSRTAKTSLVAAKPQVRKKAVSRTRTNTTRRKPSSAPSSRNGTLKSNKSVSDEKVVIQELRHELEWERQKFHALQLMTRAISEKTRVQDIVDSAIPMFRKLLRAHRCSLFIFDREANELRTTFVEGTPEIRLPASQGLVGHVVRTGTKLNIPDAYKDPRFDQSVDATTKYRTKSILSVPIKHPTRGVLGAVQMLNKQRTVPSAATHSRSRSRGQGANRNQTRTGTRAGTQKHRRKASTAADTLDIDSVIPFSDADEQLCEAFTYQVAVAISKASLWQSHELAQQRTQALLEVMKTSTAQTPVTDMLQRLVAATHNVMHVAAAELLLVDADLKQFYSHITATELKLFHKPIHADTIEGCVANLQSRYVSTSAGQCKQQFRGSLTPTGDHEAVLCVVAKDRSGRALAVLKVVGKRTSRGDDPFASSANADIRATHDDAASESDSHPVLSSADQFHREDRNLLEAMAADVSSILQRRAYEATFEAALASPDSASATTDVTASSADRNPGAVAAAASSSFTNTILWLFTSEDHGRPTLRRSASGSRILEPMSVERVSAASSSFSSAAASSPTKGLAIQQVVSDSAKYLLTPDFDAFECSMPQLRGVIAAIFHSLGFFETFRIPVKIFSSFVDAVRSGYRDNPYHNYRHAVTVLHSTYMVIAQGNAAQHLSRLQCLGMCVAALGHDINHGGFNNNYLKASYDDLALVYNDRSVLENMHASKTFRLLQDEKCNVLSGLSKDEFKEVRQLIVESILATDMAQHNDSLKALKEMVSSGVFDLGNDKHKMKLITSIVHASDVSTPFFRFSITRKWAKAISIEFNTQVEYERKNGLPVSSYLETKDDAAFAKMNLAFGQHVVWPLWQTLREILDGPVFEHFYNGLQNNRKRWTQIQNGTVSADQCIESD
jgi:GAF domain-containing protein